MVKTGKRRGKRATPESPAAVMRRQHKAQLKRERRELREIAQLARQIVNDVIRADSRLMELAAFIGARGQRAEPALERGDHAR